MATRRKFFNFGKKTRQFNKDARAKAKYFHYYRKLPLQSDVILVDSQHGSEIRGNLFYILRELRQNIVYANYTVYVTVAGGKTRAFQTLLEKNGIANVILLPHHSKDYYRVAATAKYVINDTSFEPFFIKKEGQIYLNTWHGTPLKTLGKKVKSEPHNIGNVQRNLQMADYLLFPNDFTMQHIVEDYMLENTCDATVLMCGYPRNTAFFDDDRATVIRQEQEWENKKVYVYMPTWRGVVGGADPKAGTYLQYYLYELDKRLGEDEILYVNLHPLAKKDVNFRFFQHIRTFPTEYETYEFINAADVLITDYSSVFFDFALTRKKVVLFTYDEKEYLADRGMYMGMDELPFPRVDNVDSLLQELRTPKAYEEESFLQTFCKYDSADAARLLCERVILGRKNTLEERTIPKNDKENVLIYVGNLAKNGITMSLQNLLNHLDYSRYNFFFTFDARKVWRNKEMITKLGKYMPYIGCMGEMDMSILQKLAYVLYAVKKIPFWLFWPITKSAFPYEMKRRYGNIEFSTVIQFNGYEFDTILFYSQAPCNRVIYVHSDMVNEVNIKGNQRRAILKYAYTHYDKVAVVSEDIMTPTKTFTGGRDDNFRLAVNFVNYQDILKKAERRFKTDSDTVIVPGEDRLQEILNGDGKKFITIGRFSPEKGHLRLLDAFDRVWADHPDAYMIILGGYGEMYQKTVEHAATLACRDHVVLIRSMSNPYTVLTRCDYFVLSSFYEGFGIVIAEADILGKPVISTDINGPRGFMTRYGGKLVEDSEEGLYQGMLAELNGEIQPMNIDFAAYNQEAVDQFYRLLE